MHSDLPNQQRSKGMPGFHGRRAKPLWCQGSRLLLDDEPTHLIVVPKDSKVMDRAIGVAHRRYTRMKNFSDGVRGYLFFRVDSVRVLWMSVHCWLLLVMWNSIQ